MRELKSVEEKILDRALYLFGKNGSSNVSIRAISKEAQVNVGAINYYFGSKEEMLKHVQAFYIENTRAAYSVLEDTLLSDEEKVIICANEIMEYSLKYPGSFVMNKEAARCYEEDEQSRLVIDTTNEMNHKLDQILKRVVNASQQNFSYIRTIFLSSILYPINDTGIQQLENLECKQARIDYIQYLLKMLKQTK